MKRLKKWVFLPVMCAMSMSIFLSSPMASVLAVGTIYSYSITATNVPQTVSLDENELELPLPTVKVLRSTGVESSIEATESYVIVTTPSCVVKTYEIGAAENDAYFTYNDNNTVGDLSDDKLSIDAIKLTTGDYYLQYKAVIDDKTIESETYKIAVESKKYTLGFSEDYAEKVIVPAKTDLTHDIVLPEVVVYDEDGEEKALADIAGATLQTIVKKDGSTLVTLKPDADPATEDDLYEGKKYFKPETAGTYTITYKLMSGANVVATKTLTVNATEDFDSSEIELSATYATSFPKGELGEEYNLPKLTVVDKASSTSATVNAYVKVTVKHKESGDTIAFNYEDYTFKCTKVGTYVVTYEVKDFFGNTMANKVVEIADVKDGKSPVVSFVEDYDPTIEGFEDNIVINTSLVPSYTGNKNIILPAIYATDAGTNYDTLKTTFKRQLVSPTGRTYVLDDATQGTALAVDGTTAAYNKQIKFNFLDSVYEGSFEEGNWTLRYYATDNATNKHTGSSTEFTIYIYNSDPLVDNQAPTITMGTLKASIDSKETYTFTKPTAVDYDEADATKKVDASARMYAYYFYNDGSFADADRDTLLAAMEAHFATDTFLRNVTTLDSNTMHAIKENEDKNTEYAFKLEGYTGAAGQEAIVIAVFAIDDSGNISCAYKTVEVKNTVETGLPVILVGLDTGFPTDKKQGDRIDIPAFTFGDALDKTLSVSVKVYDKNDNRVTVYDQNRNYQGIDNTTGNDLYAWELNSAYFTATIAGDYRIVFTAIDDANNMFSVTRFVNILDERPGYISVNAIASTLELGEQINLPLPELFNSDGEIDATATYEVVIAGPDTEANDGLNVFKPAAQGEYTITYSATGSNGIDMQDVVFTITVSDTTAPTVELLDEVPTTWDNTSAAITIPGFTAGDNYLIDASKTKVTVKNKYGTDITVTASGDGWTFNPAGTSGNYTVTYTAYDMNGLKTTKTYTIKVGDLWAPKISVADIDKNLPESAKIDSTYVVDKTKISIKDKTTAANEYADVDTIAGLDSDDLQITLTHETEGVISNFVTEGNKLIYTIEHTGKYTLTLSFTDNNGNVTTETREWTVSETKKDASISKETTGTILIIVSLVLLAGVILYFVLTSSNKGKNWKKSATKKLAASKKEDKAE